jgi:hypothetical protein
LSNQFGISLFSNEDLNEFRQGKNIEKCLLRSWVYVEYHMLQAFLKNYSFEDDTANLKWVAVFGQGGNSTRFERRFTLLQAINLFSKEEVEIIKKFQKDRNEVFHNIASLVMANYGEGQKTEVIDNALRAYTVMQDLERRKYLPPSEESNREKRAREK